MSELTRDIDAEEKALEDRIKKVESKMKQEENEKIKGLASGSYPVAGNRSGSFESKTMQAFGVSHPAKLLEVNTALPRYAGVDSAYRSAVKDMKEVVDNARFIAQMYYDGKKDKGDFDERKNPVAVKEIFESNYAKDVMIPMIKSFGSGVADDGGAWIPTMISSQYIEEFELERRALRAVRELPMPSSPWSLSIQKSTTEAKIATESTALSDVNFAVDTIDFTAKKLGEFFRLPEELNEDSAPPILSIARAEVAEAQMRALEQILINGDISGTHQDDDTDSGAANLAAKATSGLRKLGLANSANGSVVTFSSAVTTAKLDEMRKAMGKHGINVNDLAYVFSPAGYHQAVALDEVTSVEKFGPAATILSGVLAVFRGIEVIISEFVRDDLAASGVNTLAGPNDKSTVILFNKKRFYWGRRRPIRVRVQMDLPDQDRWLLASYQRVDFQGHPQSATEVSSVIGVDVTP